MGQGEVPERRKLCYVDTGLQCLFRFTMGLNSCHSMGGLLAADTLLEMVNSRPDKEAPLWPKIIACLAFDTPVRAFLYFLLT